MVADQIRKHGKRRQRAEGCDNLQEYLFRIPGTVNDGEAIWVPCGPVAVAFPDAAMKGEIFRFEASLAYIGSRLLVPELCPGQSLLRLKVEEQGFVGPQPAGGCFVQLETRLRVNSPAVALVDDGCVGIPLRQLDRPVLDAGPDDAAHVPGPLRTVP